ncbi:MAG: NMD3-related protein [Thermoproteus sp.]
MPTVICPICGRPAERLIEGMCESCYLERHPVLEIRKFNVVKCKYCGALYIRGRWIRPGRESEKALLERLLKDNVKVSGRVLSVDVEIGGDKVTYRISGVGSPHELIKPREFSAHYIADVVLDVCLDCRRNIWGSERGLVRIRGFPDELDDKDFVKLEAVLEHVAFEVRGKNLGSVISAERVGRSLEISTTEPKLARHIAHKIHEIIPSDYVESYKKMGRKKDRDIYHYTATIYIITVKSGDVLRRGSSYYLVLDVGRDDIYVADISSGNRARIPLYRFTEVKTERIGRGVKGEVRNGEFVDVEGRRIMDAPGYRDGVAYYVEIGDRRYIVPI